MVSNASPQSFFQLVPHVLPKDFNLHYLFFLSFTRGARGKRFHLKKELHLQEQHSLQGNETNEHNCRCWVSLEVLKTISKKKEERVFDLQISNYLDDTMKYLVIS